MKTAIIYRSWKKQEGSQGEVTFLDKEGKWHTLHLRIEVVDADLSSSLDMAKPRLDEDEVLLNTIPLK